MSQSKIPLTLEQHQQILYEILYMVDDFCKAHNIAYFLVGGSLLGAVRHKGIIPWDDDVDIAMTRENYERFLTEFHSEKTEGYEVIDFESCSDYLFPFAKVGKTGTYVKNQPNHLINIDVFVYDGLKGNFETARRNFSKINKWVGMRFTWYFGDMHILSNRIRYNISKLLFNPLKKFKTLDRKILKCLYKKAQNYTVEECDYSACIVWGIYGKGEVQPSKSFLKLSSMQFGTRVLPVPSGWHEYLTGIYSDYMSPTPPEKRCRHCKMSYIIE